MKQLLNQRGISFLEMLIGGAIMGVIGSYFMSSFKSSGEFMRGFGKKSNSEVEMVSAYNHILKIGRRATACTKPSASTLECDVDFNVPATGVTTKVHFTLSNGDLIYEAQNGASWTTTIPYKGVSSFDVCNDADMNAGTCALPNTNLSAAHKANLAPVADPTPANRFFRFRIWKNIQTTTANESAFDIQGAFFVRNPTGIGTPNLAYQWGQ